MNYICKICEQEVLEDSHWYRAHKLKMELYFLQYEPKHDLLTGEIIPFRSRDSYLNADFINKNNLKKYLKESPPEITKEYCKDFLLRRKLQKKLLYTPSQVELRTITAPSIIFLDSILKEEDGYFKYCESIGLINRFKDYKEFPQFDDKIDEIIIDSREQRPLKFPNYNVKVEKLEFADYKLSNKNRDNVVYFERKTGGDFLGTLSSGYERFQREIERASKKNETIIVMIEESLTNILSFQYLPQYKFIKKISPEFITHNMRELMQKNANVQFLFCDNKNKSIEYMQKIFKSIGKYKEIDLQLSVDLKFI